jgi:hypothetical protein
MPSRIAEAKQIYAGPIGRWIDKYAGGLPRGFAVAALTYESGGNPGTVGDAGLGEYGLMQITASFPPTVGLPAEARLDPETNVFLGELEMQLEAIKFFLDYPEVELGSADSWKLARLGFSIGYYGTKQQINAAKAAGFVRKGKVYGGVKDWVASRGNVGVSAGSQSAEKVGYRIAMIQVVWDVGQAVVAGAGGVPRLPPNPPGRQYQIPAKLVPYFQLTGASSMLALLAIAAAGVYLYKRFR